MELLEVLLPLVVFLTVVTLAAILLRRHEQITQEQMVLGRISRPAFDEELSDIDITRPARVQQGFLSDLLTRIHLIKRLQESLWQAGLYVRVGDALILMVVLAIGGVAAGAVWTGDMFGVLPLACGLVLAVLPLLYIAWRKKRRLRAFDLQLPEILDMVKSSLEAGHTLQRSLQVAVEEFSEPASSEFRIVLEQNRIGVPLARALEYMLQRIPDENLRFLVVAVKIQSEVGTSLAGIIAQLARTVRDRQRLEMRIRVLTAQPRISAMVGGLMPIILLIGMSIVNPDATKMLFHDPTGIKLTKAAAVLEALAFLAISRMVKVDF